MARVLMQVTGDLNTAKWKCEGCGSFLSYTQPIEFGASIAMVKAFSGAHKKCGAAPTTTGEGKEEADVA